MSEADEKDILIVEPFNGGSHGQLIKLILSDSEIGPRCTVISLPAKKWHWRARTSALYFSQTIPFSDSYRVIFTSSVLNLAELIALRPDLAQLKKIVYFHENQLVYPVREVKDRDFQYGYNQILTSLVANVVVFNSSFNMESFLSSISSHLKLIPDHRPKNIEAIIRPKCRVLNFPVNIDQVHCDYDSPVNFTSTSNSDQIIENNDKLPEQNTVHCVGDRDNGMFNDEPGISKVNTVVQECCTNSDKGFEHSDTGSKSHSLSHTHLENNRIRYRQYDTKRNVTEAQDRSNQHTVLKNEFSKPLKGNDPCLHIVWPHRWEHDKDPESFFKAILQLQSEGFDFCVSVVGETFTDVPCIFPLVKPQLAEKIVAWGYQTRQNYLRILHSAHVVVSTAQHEFFGVSMLEATGHGCYPLCPKRLVYPEIYPEECLYSTQAQLVKRLRRFCQRPDLVKGDQFKELVETFSWPRLQEEYRKLLLE